MPNPPLSPSRRSELRAQAHKLDPVVIIGDKGLTDEVVAEIDRSLTAHELIKVRAATDDRKLREEWMRAICERLEAHSVQQIGKVLVVYRENPEEKAGESAAVKRSERPRVPASAGRATHSAHRQSRTPSRPPESGPRRRRPRTSR